MRDHVVVSVKHGLMSIMHYGKHDVCRAPESLPCTKPPHVHGKDTRYRAYARKTLVRFLSFVVSHSDACCQSCPILIPEDRRQHLILDLIYAYTRENGFCKISNWTFQLRLNCPSAPAPSWLLEVDAATFANMFATNVMLVHGGARACQW